MYSFLFKWSKEKKLMLKRWLVTQLTKQKCQPPWHANTKREAFWTSFISFRRWDIATQSHHHANFMNVVVVGYSSRRASCWCQQGEPLYSNYMFTWEAEIRTISLLLASPSKSRLVVSGNETFINAARRQWW